VRQINCVLCGSGDKKVLAVQEFDDEYLNLIDPAYQREARRWVACGACNFVYHDPQLDAKDTQVLYDKFRDSSFRNETPDQYFDRITTLPREQSENLAKVEWLRDRLPAEFSRGGKILDIGCGGGVFLYTFLQNAPGWQASGVEPTRAFAELAARRLARPVLASNYSGGVCGQGFDIISCNQVLEHTIDPLAFLRDIRADLAVGGHLYIEVPDTSDFDLLPPQHDRFLMQHLWYFDSDSLGRLAVKAGFEVAVRELQLTKRGRKNLVALLRRSV